MNEETLAMVRMPLEVTYSEVRVHERLIGIIGNSNDKHITARSRKGCLLIPKQLRHMSEADGFF